MMNIRIEKWMMSVALFTASCTLFAWGHPPNNHNHVYQNQTHAQQQYQTHAQQQWQNLINNYYTIPNHPHYDHGHSYPVCNQYGCHTPCNHNFSACPLITTNVSFPVIPQWFVIRIQTSIFHYCQYQYQWCLWNTHPYYQRACTAQYFNCMGYSPYYPY